jgi:hypothetical protein
MGDKSNYLEEKEQIKKDLYEFSTPLWYYKLVTKDDKLGFRILFTTLVSGTLAAIIAYAIFIIIDIFTPYYITWFVFILFFIIWFFFFYVLWIKSVKKMRINIYERFAMRCKEISLILAMLSMDKDLLIDTYSITYLTNNIKRMVKIDKKLDSTIKEKLCKFSEKLDNIYATIKKPENFQDEMMSLSSHLDGLAKVAYTGHSIHPVLLDEALSVLNKIVIPSKITRLHNVISSIVDVIRKSNYLKNAIYLVFDGCIFVAIFFLSQRYLGTDVNTAYIGAIGISGVILSFILAPWKKLM